MPRGKSTTLADSKRYLKTLKVGDTIEVFPRGTRAGSIAIARGTIRRVRATTVSIFEGPQDYSYNVAAYRVVKQ